MIVLAKDAFTGKTAIGFAIDLWNTIVGFAWGILSKTPQEYSPESFNISTGAIWNLFALLGSALVMIFFYFGWIRDSFKLKDDIDVQDMVKMFLKLVLVEGAYVFALQLIPQILVGFSKLVTRIGNIARGAGTDSYDVTRKIGTIDKNAVLDNIPDIEFKGVSDFFKSGITGALLVTLTSVGVICVAFVCGYQILMVAVGRLIKIFILIPFGALSLSSLAGGDGTNRVAFNWIKEFLLVAGEVIAIALVLIIGSIFIADGNLMNIFIDLSSDSTTLQMVVPSLTIILSFMMVAGAVKGVDELLHKVF